jgi:putative transposase
MEYRRAFVPGGSFFFTLVTEKRRPIFSDAESVDVLRKAFRQVKGKRPFVIHAIVVLPDHLHTIWTLPPDDGDFATRWRLIKTWFTKNCPDLPRTTPNPARIRKNGQAIWQHRYWEHLLRDDDDFNRHMDYVHYNPVKHGYVRSPADWPYSSFHRCLSRGLYAPDWGTSEPNLRGVGRE